VEGVGHNIPNIDGLDSIIRREPPSPVSEWVGFASYAEGRRHGPFDVANVCPETCVPATVAQTSDFATLRRLLIFQWFPYCEKVLLQLKQLAIHLCKCRSATPESPPITRTQQPGL
jgi:hypothetical protein